MDGRSRSLLGLAIAVVALLVIVSFFTVFQPQSKNETSPFRINSDAEMVSSASRMGWPGNGSIENPFIVDGLSIKTESSAPGIYIGNTSYHFILSHCVLNGTFMGMSFVGDGIEFFNLSNGTIRNNTLINCRVYLLMCNSTRLDNNSISARYLPIHLTNCSDCLVLNNQISSRDQTSLFEAVENMRFENNTVTTSIGAESVELQSCRNNHLINNNMNGAVILITGHDNLIENNQLSSAIFSAIRISGGWSNEVQGNRITGGEGGNGVELVDTETNQIIGNEITATYGYGIILTNVTNNTCISNVLKGSHGSGDQRNPDHVQASDNSGSNMWNDSTGGNYWSDWGGASAVQPYLIDGGAGAADYRPLSDLPPSPPPDEKALSSIRINNNSEMASMASKWGWPGGGSLETPYVISDLTLNASNESPCIFIGNTSLYFTISNCSFYGVPVEREPIIGNGIEFSNLNNATVRGCYVYNCSLGVILRHCSSILLINNIITEFSPSRDAASCIATWLDHSNNVTIEGNRFEGRMAYKIADSNNNLIQENVGSALNAINSNDNWIFNNDIRQKYDSIYMNGCNHTILSNNDVSGYYNPFSLINSTGGQISFNNISGGPGFSAPLLQRIDNMMLDNNTISGFPGMSISVESSNNSTLINNHLIGACLILDSFGITFERNDFPNSYFSGLFISGGGSNNFLENNITNSLTNSIVVNDSDLNVFMRNEIRASDYAILVKGSNNNTIISNNIQGTHTSIPGPDVQAFDDTGMNNWNDSQGGNFWRGWSGSQTGQPYPIDGGAGAADLRPLSSPLII